jgi:hypothetical protein
MRRERACGQGSRSSLHSLSFSCQRMNWSRPPTFYAAARAFDALPCLRCLILATEQLCTNRGGCKQHSSRRRSSRETVHGRCHVSLWTQTEVNCIAVLVHCTVEIDPAAAHLQLGLVDAPGAANFACIASPALFELRDISLHPTHDGRMRKLQSTFSHHLDQIPKAQLIAKVPTYAQQDHLTIKVSTRNNDFVPFRLLIPVPRSQNNTVPDGNSAICTRARVIADVRKFLCAGGSPRPEAHPRWHRRASHKGDLNLWLLTRLAAIAYVCHFYRTHFVPHSVINCS